MKKNILFYCLFFVLVFLMVGSLFLDLNKKDNTNKNTKITLAEVAHTIFYAPMYVSIEKNFFEEYGISVDLILTSGADKVAASVLSGDADIGFSGSESTIYVYNASEDDYLQTFAQLTQKDGSFLVSRNKYDDFTLNDLKGKNVIGGRAGFRL